MNRLESTIAQNKEMTKWFGIATALIAFTIVYNLLEGLVSIYFGLEDESFTLFGFGTDSFIEVISGIGVAHMIYRTSTNPESKRDDFERTALRITGTAFYILVAGLVVTALYNIWTNHQPETTFWGIVISLISILIMWALILGKTKAGKELNSPAILADAQCTKVCIYMSIVLLASSIIYALARIPYIDSIGCLGLAYFSFREGSECFEKAKSNDLCSCDHC
jgi:divalent metal cation (Fe/Co/Zn/Cd) transporter